MARRTTTTNNDNDVFGQNVAADPPGAPEGNAQSGDPVLPAAAPPKPKRKPRGPNKPKPGTITVQTSASMVQSAIVELLTAHVAQSKGAEVAAEMELQLLTGEGWVAADHSTIVVRFATKGNDAVQRATVVAEMLNRDPV